MFDWSRPRRPAPRVRLRVEPVLEDRVVPCTGSDCPTLAAAGPPPAAVAAAAAVDPVRPVAVAPAAVSIGTLYFEPTVTDALVVVDPPATVALAPGLPPAKANDKTVVPAAVPPLPAERPDRTNF